MFVFLILLFSILFFFSLFLFPALRLRQSVVKVVRLLRKNNAIDEVSAKTTLELGIRVQSRLEKLIQMRDYKPEALQFLINNGIVKTADDDRFYLCEEQLAAVKKEMASSGGNIHGTWKLIVPPHL